MCSMKKPKIQTVEVAPPPEPDPEQAKFVDIGGALTGAARRRFAYVPSSGVSGPVSILTPGGFGKRSLLG